MSEKQTTPPVQNSEVAVEKAKDFFTRNSKMILGIGGGLLVLVVGFYVYRNFFQKPKEEKAMAALYKAEEYFRLDSVNLALNGDGTNPGLLTIVSKYSGTDAANLAHFYAGSCFAKLDDNDNVIKHLKDFSTDSKMTQQRAYLLLGDAYGDKGEFKQALDYYKKSASHFNEDENASAEALFRAASLSASALNDKAEAIKLFTQLKEKYSKSTRGQEVDLYLAQLGALNVN
jgi:tetratricopeptide (TPR) repeat protein